MKNNIEDILNAFYNIASSQEETYKGARLLSLEEILDCSEDMQVDFSAIGLIPIFDIFDNDYICYQTKNNKWCIFNIVDEISFKKDSTLQELLLFKS